MRKIKFFISIIFIMFIVSKSYSQREKDFWDKIFWGGSIGFQFSSITQIDASPLIGYSITDRWKAGIGATYQYYRDNRPLYNFETDIYGGRLFSSFVLVNELKKILPVNSNGTGLFVHGEVELISLETAVFDPSHKYPGQSRFYIASYLIGLGIKQQMGERSFINLTVLWNLNELTYSPYSNPVMRVGFSF